jgi:single-strand DNA-binding protein
MGTETTTKRGTRAASPDPAENARNEVRLRGRVGAAAEERVLPSGDVIATFRVIVPRPPARAVSASVDTLDVVCWAAVPRRAAGRLEAGDVVEVEGALRRRFFGVPGGRSSRYEVEAARVRRVSGGRRAGT